MAAPVRRSVALLAAVAIWAWGGFGGAVARGYVSRVSVTGSAISRPVAAGFLGLAFEHSTIPRWVGDGSQPVNPVLVQLIRALDPVGRPVLRIGGQSTDRSWWPVPGMRRPLGITYDLTSSWTASARALAQATDARLLLGINLEANRTRIDEVEAAQLLKGIGRAYIEALEIGNEPLLYPLVPWYKRLGGLTLPWYSHKGTAVYSRARTYGPQDFAAEFARTVRVIPRLPIAGPETGNPPWLQEFRKFLGPRSQVRMLTSHAYGLNQCITNPAILQYPSVPHLLDIAASRGLLNGVAPYVALVHRDRGNYRIDEMSSVSCTGRAGVSNTMASALWVMDALFSIARANIDGVNIHTYPHVLNGLFDFTRPQGQWEAAVHPIYYGALMFAQAAPTGSRLLRIESGSQARLRAWATLGADHRVRVLLINDSLASSALGVLSAPRGLRSSTATVERLLAPSAYATGGITLGGRSFGAITPTGVLPAPVLQTVAPDRGRYVVRLPAASAALLTISRDG